LNFYKNLRKRRVGKVKLPNFIIAGGVATGTSFLSAALSHHPEIYLPRVQRPEPNFFHYTDKFEKGLVWYSNTWFSEVGDEIAVGERSSLLLPSLSAPSRVHESLPGVKLIFCLRNPIERAWGNYRFSVLEGLETLPFHEAIEVETQRAAQAEGRWAEVQPHAYLARSRYSNSLLEFLDLFGSSNILLLKSEELGNQPKETLKKVCEFLGVNPEVQIPLPPNYSSPSVLDPLVQARLRSYFGARFPDLIEGIRRNDLSLDEFKSTEDLAMFEELRLNLTNGKQPLEESDRRRLNELLSDEVARVAKIVDFNVDDWV
jgi:hypothetical protein